MDDDDLMLSPEVAALTRLPLGTLRYYRYCGDGPPSFKIGRRVMYRRQAVLAWLADQEFAEARGRSGP